MTKHKPGSTLIHSLVAMSGQSQTLTIPRAFVAFTGSIDRALILNQLLFWSATKGGDWFYKSDQELCDETCLGRAQLRSAVQWLTAVGLFERCIRRANGAPTAHYRLGNLDEQWAQWIDAGMPARERMRSDDCSKSNNRLCEIEQT